jgi:hypothetical protein
MNKAAGPGSLDLPPRQGRVEATVTMTRKPQAGSHEARTIKMQVGSAPAESPAFHVRALRAPAHACKGGKENPAGALESTRHPRPRSRV